MVADDERNVANQLSALVPIEQIVQAVIVFRHEQPDAIVKVKVETSEIPLNAHQEQVAQGVLVLVRVQNVGVVSVQELADCGDNSFAVGTVNKQNAGVGHVPRGGWQSRAHHLSG